MGSYAQWRAGGSKTARVIYLSAASWVLAEEVVDDIRARFPPADTYFAGQGPEADIWAAVSAYPDDPGTQRLVVVRDAQRMKAWKSHLPALLDAYRAMGGCTVLFVSSERDYPPADSFHGAALRKSHGALLVLASAPDRKDRRGRPEWVETWAASRLPGYPASLARCILDLSGDDLRAARDLCAKALVVLPEYDERRARQVVTDLAGEPADEFAWAVVEGSRKDAFASAALLSSTQLGYAIGTLHGWLDDLVVVHPAAARRATLREIGALGVPTYSAMRLLPVAARYPPARISRDRGVLLTAAGAWKSGCRAGVGEVIAALW